MLGGLWEFPGGKIKNDEKSKDACIREIKEETNLSVDVDSHLVRIKHAYTHFKIVMDVFCCSYISGKVKLNGPVDHRWIKLDKLDDYPFPRANHKFFAELKQWSDKEFGLRPLRVVGSPYEPEAIGAGPMPRREVGMRKESEDGKVGGLEDGGK